MAEIIQYDFKTKQKVVTYRVKEVECDNCFKIFKYDSRYPMKRPLVVRTQKKFYYCFECVSDMYYVLLDEYNKTREESDSGE